VASGLVVVVVVVVVVGYGGSRVLVARGKMIGTISIYKYSYSYTLTP
jgi:hypothetical protein